MSNQFTADADPFQGFDIKVEVPGVSGQLVGAFTSAMFKIVNQTETYLTLNSRVPRHLDGEIVTVWAAEQGLVNPKPLTNTFGSAFAGAMSSVTARNTRIPRSARFELKFSIGVAPADAQSGTFIAGTTAGDRTQSALQTTTYTFKVKNCKVDTYSFGVTAGRNIVANSWQGTGEGIEYKAE